MKRICNFLHLQTTVPHYNMKQLSARGCKYYWHDSCKYYWHDSCKTTGMIQMDQLYLGKGLTLEMQLQIILNPWHYNRLFCWLKQYQSTSNKATNTLLTQHNTNTNQQHITKALKKLLSEINLVTTLLTPSLVYSSTSLS